MFKHVEDLFINRERVLRGFHKLLASPAKSVMRIRAPQYMGKTWLMHKMQYQCQQPGINFPVARVEFRDPLDLDRITDHLGLIRLLRDSFEQPHFFSLLNHTINALTTSVPGSIRNTRGTKQLATLAQQIESVYTMTDLRRMARFLEVEFESISGDTLHDKAYGMVTYFQQRNKTTILLEYLVTDRPNIQWQPYFDRLPNTTLALPTAVLGTSSRARSTMQNISALDISQSGVSQSGVSQSGTTNAPEVGHRNGTSHSDGFVQDLDLLLPTYANNTERQHIERQISNAFFECMGNLIRQNGRAVLLLDAYEEIPQVADTFLHEQLLPRLLHDPWDKLVIIIAGREIPDITARALQSKTVTTDLQRFNKEYVIEFMRSRNVPEDSTRWTPQSALTFSGGVPGILALIADQALAAIQDEDADFFN